MIYDIVSLSSLFFLHIALPLLMSLFLPVSLWRRLLLTRNQDVQALRLLG